MKFKIDKDLAIRSLPIIISIIELFFAWQANSISEKNRIDVRELNKLNVDPKIAFRANFKPSNGRKSQIEISNSGSLEIVQLEIKLIELRYDTEKRKIRMANSSGDSNWKLDSLNINRSENLPIPTPWFDYSYYKELCDLEKKPIETIVIEALIIFKRQSDLKQYVKRAFYFFDSDGKIKKENMISDISKFSEILEAARNQQLDMTMIEHVSIMNSDILHDYNR